MSDEGTAGVVAETSGGRIDCDVACHGCGYNLRTMALDGRCPECNEAVAVTLEVLDLARAPEWLGRIRAGLALYPVAGVVVIVAAVLQILPSMLNLAYWREEIPYPLYLAGRLLAFLLLAVAPMGLVWWYEWLLTTPRDVGPCQRSIHRRVMRVLIAVEIAFWLATRVLQESGLYTAETLLNGLNFMATVLWSWCVWRWLEAIVMPLRRPGLMKHIRLLQWVVPAFLVVRVGSSYGMNFVAFRFGGRIALVILLGILALMLLAVAIWALVILLVTRYRLARVVSPAAKYFGDLGLAFVLLGRGMRQAGRWVKFAVTYHGKGKDG